MSNPALKVAQFNGSSDGFTITGPERYDDGLWLEEGTTNAVTNPSFETNTTGWTSVASAVLTRITSEHYSGVAACEIVTNGSGSQGMLTQVTGPSQGQTWTGTFRVKGVAGTSVRVLIRDTVSAVPGSLSSTTVVLDGEDNGWDVIPFTRTLTDVGANGCQVRFDVSSVSGTFIIDAVQLEQKDHATSYTDSIRAASSAAISPSGILSPSSGAIAFRVTPTIETGLEEIWGECGVKGSGTDHVQWGRDASTHPFVEWSANNAAYQRLTGTETLAAGVECLFYTDWDGTIIRLSIDNGTIQTDTRDAVSDSWGAGDFVLKAE